MTGRRLRELLSAPLVLAGALGFLFEEVLWGWFSRLMEAVGRWPPVRSVESFIRRLPPYAALALFALPVGIVWPVKLAALYLIAVGRIKTGVLLLAAGESLGAAITARIYALCRPALHTLAWFVRVEAIVLRISAWAHDHIARLPLWQKTRRTTRHLLDRLRLARRRAFSQPPGE